MTNRTLDKTTRERLLKQWREGITLDATTRANLGITAEAARETLREYATDADRAQRWQAHGERLRRWPDSTMLKAIKNANTNNRPNGPTTNDYKQARQQAGNDTVPSLESVLLRFGSWREALRAAGYNIASVPTMARREYDDSDLIAIARKVAADNNGRLPSIETYEALRAHDTSLPSSSLFRNRFGGWSRVRELAR